MSEVNWGLRQELRELKDLVAKQAAAFVDRYREKILEKTRVSNPAGEHPVKRKVEDVGEAEQRRHRQVGKG